MASGKELPIGDPKVAPLIPGEGEGTAAPGVQGGEGLLPEQTPEDSVVQPGVGKPGEPVAQPVEGAGAVVPPEPAAKPGQTAEERIQALTTEVRDLRAQLSAVEDLEDLADELEEAMGNLRSLAILPSDSPIPPGGVAPAVPPVEVPKGVEAQLQGLSQRLDQLQDVIQKGTVTPDERVAYQRFSKLEGDLLKRADITSEKEVEMVKEMISTAMDRGNFDWKRPRVAKRVVRGVIDKYREMKTTMLGTAVQPGKPPVAEPGAPVTPAPAQHVPAPEQEGIDPLDQAHQELGPMIEQIFKTKGAGVV